MKRNPLIGVLFVFVLILTLTPVSAQQFNENESLFKPEPPRQGPEFGVQAGTSFSAGSGGFNMFSQSISPHMRWNVSPRWSLTVGTVFSTASINGVNSFNNNPLMGGGFQMGPQRAFSSTAYAMGSYQLNPRLIISGGAWMEANNMSRSFDVQMNPQAFSMGGKGMMLGMDYRITESLHFGAQVRMSSGYNPFNPLYNLGPLPGQGFQSSPFNRFGGW